MSIGQKKLAPGLSRIEHTVRILICSIYELHVFVISLIFLWIKRDHVRWQSLVYLVEFYDKLDDDD